MNFSKISSRVLVTVLFVCIFLFRVQAQISDFALTNFEDADSMAALYPNHSLLNLKILSDKLTIPLKTPEEKFRAIYKWVCNNIENDYSLYTENKRKREKVSDPEKLAEWNKKFSVRVFETLAEKHRTVCSGYAYLVKELAYHAGLSCTIIDGYGRTAEANIGGKGIINHSWNAIQLNDKWYLCDPTWSSGAIDKELSSFVKKFDPSYFLADPSLFIRNHFPMDSSWALLPNKPTLNIFLNRPLTYSSIYEYKIAQVFPETFSIQTTRGKKVSFQFMKESNKPIENAELKIVNSNTPRSVYPKPYIDQSGFYCIDHSFTMKGTYVVHILLDGNYVFTYEVTVK